MRSHTSQVSYRKLTGESEQETKLISCFDEIFTELIKISSNKDNIVRWGHLFQYVFRLAISKLPVPCILSSFSDNMSWHASISWQNVHVKSTQVFLDTPATSQFFLHWHHQHILLLRSLLWTKQVTNQKLMKRSALYHLSNFLSARQ